MRSGLVGALAAAAALVAAAPSAATARYVTPTGPAGGACTGPTAGGANSACAFIPLT